MKRKKEFNEHYIYDDYVIIKLTRKSGEKLDCIIDKEDLEKINFIHWNLAQAPNINYWYAQATQYLGRENGKSKQNILHMHKLILDVPKGRDVLVDHINHNGLDNRKCNLRKTTNDKNTKHRKGANRNNTSGYRNVSWLESYKKWCVQLQIDGKNKLLGKFDDVNEAGDFAEKMRKKYYGEFKGES